MLSHTKIIVISLINSFLFFYMDDPDNHHTDRKLWGNGLEDTLIEMMHEDVISGKVRAGKFSRGNHVLYAQHLSTLGSKLFNDEQVKEKIKRLKKKQRMFTNLMGQTGMRWDPYTKTVIGSDEHWANAIGVKSDWKYFRNASCPLYVELCMIFGSSVATGTQSRVHDFSNSIDISRRPSEQKGQANPYQEDLCRYLEEVKNTSVARRKCYEGWAKASTSKRSKGSMDSDDTFRPFARCVTLLQKIEPKLPVDNFFRAYDVLRESSAEQRGFLHMDGEHRRLWAMRC
ncbi:uncharacterized protein LOC121259082 [Juglans microcarpa x Juglans regia]|uniref:uncharacterized protein LOC121259082 n=1 Tax=Juglans microcarpa x Juglans regia TaxID=2249226 RepID=UPI001B7D9CF3|nr:uncharacterized protein LOC121259082 [Juglans microcarpa x Juglans regia]XP_041016507.1 uncharacterized protein LOC121259082 [Juglans microcarpa x Juglans regia]